MTEPQDPVEKARYHLKEGRGHVNLRVVIKDLFDAYDKVQHLVTEMEDLPEEESVIVEAKVTLPLKGRMLRTSNGSGLDDVPYAIWHSLNSILFQSTRDGKPYIKLRYEGGGAAHCKWDHSEQVHRANQTSVFFAGVASLELVPENAPRVRPLGEEEEEDDDNEQRDRPVAPSGIRITVNGGTLGAKEPRRAYVGGRTPDV